MMDEDVSMMTGRQAALEAKPSKAQEMKLGRLADVQARLPLVFELGGKRFRLIEHEGALMAHAATCPHMLGPLENAEIVEGAIRCPWHGYVFDVQTGEARTGQACQLAKAPEIEVTAAGDVVARFGLSAE